MSRVRLSRPSTAASSKTLGGGKATQLSHDMQLQLKKLLLIISKGEKSIERQRQRLAKNEKFEPYAAFMRVDRDENGVIGSVEILRFLRENGVEEATEADCFLIVKYFDSDEDGYLNFQDFLQLILPCDNQALRSKVVQRPNYAVSRTDFLGVDIESDLTRLFEKEIAFNRVTEEMKQQLESNKSFDYSKAYYSIDDWNFGYIDRRNMKIFFKKHGYIASNEDVIAILRRMDLDADARLTKQEFIEGISPEEPYSKAMKRQRSRSASKRQLRTSTTPTFKRHHSRKSSVLSRGGAGGTGTAPTITIGERPGDMLILNENQKYPVRVQALDRSMNRIQSSRSPLKGNRPILREIDSYSYRYRTPKSMSRHRFPSAPRTPKLSNRAAYVSSANRSFTTGGICFSGRQRSSHKRNNSKSKVYSSLTRKNSRTKSSGGLCAGGAYTITSMMRPGAMMKLKKGTAYRKVRDQKTTRSSHQPSRQYQGAGGSRTYNYARNGGKRTMDIEEVNSSMHAPSCSSNRGHQSRGKINGDYELVGNRTFGAPKHFNRTLNHEDRSERTRATKRIGDGETTLYPRFDRAEMDPEDEESQNVSRRDAPYPGTSNFGGPESMSSTLQISHLISRHNDDRSPIQNNLSPRSQHLRSHVQQTNQPTPQSAQRSIHHQKHGSNPHNDDYSPCERSVQSHYSMLRKDGLTYYDDFSQVQSYIHHQPSQSDLHSRRSQSRQRVPKEKKILFEALQDMIQLEKDLERLKVELTLREDFNLIDGFGLLDVQGKGYISPVELRESLHEMSLKANIDEIHLVFERFNTLQDGILKYSEFSEALMPQDQHYARLLGTKKLQFISKTTRWPFDGHTMSKYLQLWDMIIQNEKAIESIRQKMHKRHRFDTRAAFEMCDINRDGSVTLQELRQFLYEMECFVSSDDLQLLMNRFDKNKDGRISMRDFECEFTPKSPFNY